MIIDKIAKRVFLAFTCRTLVKTHGFSDFCEKGIIIFNYYHYPLLFVYPLNENEAQVIYTLKAEDAFEDFGQHVVNTSKEVELQNILRRYNYNIKNFRALIFNDLIANGIGNQNSYRFLFDSSFTKSIVEVKQLLLNDYDVSLQQFNKVFEDKNKFDEIKIDNINFILNNTKLNAQDLNNIYNEIKNLLPSKLHNILYGKVQIRDEFKTNRIGDYNRNDDVIRTGGNKQQFITTTMHELGHRWRNKFSNRKQISELKKLYDNCNGKHLKLNEGDIIKFNGSNEELIYHGISLGSLYFTSNYDHKPHFYKLIAIRSINTINGQKVQKYEFPNNYSKTKFEEFIAVCFQYVYCNLSMDERLKEKVKNIIEGM